MSTFEIPDDHVARRIAADVVMIDVWQGEPYVTLIRRRDNPDKLALPGGHQKPEDATVLETAQRELLEETLVNLEQGELQLLDFLDVSGRDTRPGLPRVSVVFMAVIDHERAMTATPGDDASAVKRHRLKDVTEDMMAFDHFLVIAKIQQELSLCCHGCCT